MTRIPESRYAPENLCLRGCVAPEPDPLLLERHCVVDVGER
jgi:hypothetical protein